MSPKSVDYLCLECLENFSQIKKMLSNLGVTFAVNTNLLMNFDYYTRLVFNFTLKDEDNSKVVLAGGGRFDSLATYISELPLAAVGFSFNIDRVLSVVKGRGNFSTKRNNFSICVCTVSENMELLMLQIAHELHANEICTIIEVNKVPLENINDFVTQSKCNMYLVFREDLIREGKIMISYNELNNGKPFQEIINLSDIMGNIQRIKKRLNL